LRLKPLVIDGKLEDCLMLLATLWAIKDYPHREVFGEILKPMDDACRYEEKVAWAKGRATFAVDESPSSLENDA
jgi:hypothetical protein